MSVLCVLLTASCTATLLSTELLKSWRVKCFIRRHLHYRITSVITKHIFTWFCLRATNRAEIMDPAKAAHTRHTPPVVTEGTAAPRDCSENQGGEIPLNFLWSQGGDCLTVNDKKKQMTDTKDNIQMCLLTLRRPDLHQRRGHRTELEPNDWWECGGASWPRLKNTHTHSQSKVVSLFWSVIRLLQILKFSSSSTCAHTHTHLYLYLSDDTNWLNTFHNLNHTN